jgi:multiple sugar transport system ATP-binding protein
MEAGLDRASGGCGGFAMPGVQLQRVTKIHRGSRGEEVVALREATVALDDGRCTVVVGPSGSGKTTLLRLIAGLEEPTSGTLEMEGRSVAGVPSKDRGVAMVFQDHPLFHHLDVAGNLALGLKLRRVPPAEQAVRLREVADWLDLGRLVDRMPATLSGGERQRVALGMALVQRPRLLLLDEPLAHLDARWRVQLRRDFRSLQRRLGLTWIQVTHDQSEALALADRLVVLDDGVVQQAGSPTEVYERPANRFVAEFLGAPGMNVLEGRLVGMAENRPRFQCTDGGGAVGEFRWGSACPARSADTPILMGFRPEWVRLEPEAVGNLPATEAVTTHGEVSVVEPLGHETWVHVGVGTNRWVVARGAGLGRWQPGDRVTLVIPQDAVHWFDATTGARVDG